MENDAPTKTESTYGKLTAVVTYSTRYIEKKGKQVLTPIVLGNGVSVNTIIILPTFFCWEVVLDVTKESAISDAFNIWFTIVFKSVYS